MLSLRSRFPILSIQCSQMLVVMTRSDCKLDKSWVKLFIDNAASVQDLSLAKLQSKILDIYTFYLFIPLHVVFEELTLYQKCLTKCVGDSFFYTIQCNVWKILKKLGIIHFAQNIHFWIMNHFTWIYFVILSTLYRICSGQISRLDFKFGRSMKACCREPS